MLDKPKLHHWEDSLVPPAAWQQGLIWFFRITVPSMLPQDSLQKLINSYRPRHLFILECNLASCCWRRFCLLCRFNVQARFWCKLRIFSTLHWPVWSSLLHASTCCFLSELWLPGLCSLLSTEFFFKEVIWPWELLIRESGWNSERIQSVGLLLGGRFQSKGSKGLRCSVREDGGDNCTPTATPTQFMFTQNLRMWPHWEIESLQVQDKVILDLSES